MANGIQKSAFDVILEWASATGRFGWQSDAARRVLQNGAVNDNEIDEILANVKAENGKGEASSSSLLTEAHVPSSSQRSKAISLRSLSSVEGVNQLASGQSLDLSGEGISVIYGQNGAGKSGYTRILKSACLARSPGEIYGNVFDANSPLPSAKIGFEEGAAQSEIQWDGTRVQELGSVTVFDRDASLSHVRDQNEIFFRPFGLDVPDELATLFSKLKERLQAEEISLAEQRNAVFDGPIWSPDTTIGLAMSDLNASTEVSKVFENQPLSPAETARLNELAADLSKDPKTAASDLRNQASQITTFVSYIERLLNDLGDESFKQLKSLANNAIEARSAATAASKLAFGDLSIDGVGRAEWRALWSSAERFSLVAKEKGAAFPPGVGDVCLLCHQSIDDVTASRMENFQHFVASDTESRAEQAEKIFNERAASAKTARVDLRLNSAAYRSVKQRSSDVARSTLKGLAVLRVRSWMATHDQKTVASEKVPEFVQVDLSKMRQIANEIENYAQSLEGTAGNASRLALEKELRELKDRAVTERLQDIAEIEVKRLRELDLVQRCIKQTGTAAITNLGNKIADEVVTPRMQDRFLDEIVKIAGSNIRVSLIRAGGKNGSPKYKVSLLASPKSKVHLVLSEGEQTCVALAAYLAELANTSNRSSLVFDDPVTSLDSRRCSKFDRLSLGSSGGSWFVSLHISFWKYFRYHGRSVGDQRARRWWAASHDGTAYACDS